MSSDLKFFCNFTWFDQIFFIQNQQGGRHFFEVSDTFFQHLINLQSQIKETNVNLGKENKTTHSKAILNSR